MDVKVLALYISEDGHLSDFLIHFLKQFARQYNFKLVYNEKYTLFNQMRWTGGEEAPSRKIDKEKSIGNMFLSKILGRHVWRVEKIFPFIPKRNHTKARIPLSLW